MPSNFERSDIIIMELLNTDLIICCITFIGTFAIACYTHFQNSKLKFFDVYFKNKVEAYYNFIDAALKYSMKKSNSDELLKASYKAKLFCNHKNEKTINEFISTINKFVYQQSISANEYNSQIQECLLSFKKDIEDCRKFKY
jgi:hypothetical protein